jgi:hypothetical protein
MAIKDAGEKAKKELADLTGFHSPSLVGVRKTGKSSGWIFEIELVEKKSIPEGMDIIGLYEAEADANGGISTYERKNTRRRIDDVRAEGNTE